MTYCQKLEIKIGIGSLCYGTSDLILAKQSDPGKGVTNGNLGPIYVHICIL